MTDQTQTAPDLAALEALAEAATPGPWVVDEDGYDLRVILPPDGTPGVAIVCEGIHQGYDEGEADAAFIAAADPSTVLWLIREVSDLRAEVAELERQLDADAKHAALGPGESCDVCTHRSFEEILADCESLSADIEKAEATIERVRALVADWQANGNSRDLGDRAAEVWHQASQQMLTALDGSEPE